MNVEGMTDDSDSDTIVPAPNVIGARVVRRPGSLWAQRNNLVVDRFAAFAMTERMWRVRPLL